MCVEHLRCAHLVDKAEASLSKLVGGAEVAGGRCYRLEGEERQLALLAALCFLLIRLLRP